MLTLCLHDNLGHQFQPVEIPVVGKFFGSLDNSAMHRELESPFEWSRRKKKCAVLVHPAKRLFVHAVWFVGVSRMSFFPLQVAEATGTDITQPLSPGVDAKELAHKMSQLSAGVGLHLLLGCRGHYTSKQNCMVGRGYCTYPRPSRDRCKLPWAHLQSRAERGSCSTAHHLKTWQWWWHHTHNSSLVWIVGASVTVATVSCIVLWASHMSSHRGIRCIRNAYIIISAAAPAQPKPRRRSSMGHDVNCHFYSVKVWDWSAKCHSWMLCGVCIHCQ